MLQCRSRIRAEQHHTQDLNNILYCIILVLYHTIHFVLEEFANGEFLYQCKNLELSKSSIKIQKALHETANEKRSLH